VNCTTIDWYSDWPQDALDCVARKLLGEIEMENPIRESCVEMMKTFHKQAKQQAEIFLTE